MKQVYRVEYFDKNCWIILSRHRNEDFAVINAKVKARKYPVRVIYDGTIVYQEGKK
jgi:hypothetical protein